MNDEFDMSTRVLFTGKGEVTTETFTLGDPGPGQVRLRTRVSLISAGTEGIVLHRKFSPGTHWDSWVKYPFFPGYSAISEIEAIGEGVDGLKVGDRVATRTGHATGNLVDAARAYRVPDELSDESAAWFALAKIAYSGAQAAELRLGQRVLVIGAGPVGQMALRWVVAAGAEAVALDPIQERLAFAARTGAQTLCLAADAAGDAVRDAFGGQMPEVVIDSTGYAPVFSAALALAADRGRVVILGDTGSPEEQRLTPDVIRRRLSIVGAHDMHLPEVDASYRPFFRLAAAGRFAVEGLVTHRFRSTEAEEAYAMSARGREAMGVVFDWS